MTISDDFPDQRRELAGIVCGRCEDVFPPDVMTLYELEPDARPVYAYACPSCMEEVIWS